MPRQPAWGSHRKRTPIENKDWSRQHCIVCGERKKKAENWRYARIGDNNNEEWGSEQEESINHTHNENTLHARAKDA